MTSNALDDRLANTTALVAAFDSHGRRLSGVEGFLEGGLTEAEAFVAGFQRINGAPPAPGVVKRAAATWLEPEAPATVVDDGVYLRTLCSSALPDGGLQLMAVCHDRRPAPPDTIGTIAETSLLAICVFDAENGDVEYMNSRAALLFEATIRNINDVVAEPFSLAQGLSALRRSGRIEAFRLEAQAANGRTIWLDTWANLISNDGRELVSATFRDVTGSVENADDAGAARTLLSDTLRALDEGLAVFDEDGRLIVCNDRFREHNAGVAEYLEPGVYWETILRESARRRISKASRNREAAWVIERLRATDAFETYEDERSDGAVIQAMSMPTSLGGFIILESDVTARRYAERSAQESDQLLSTILEASPANLCMSRIGSGEIIYQSPACARLFGVDGNALDQFARPLDRADFLTELLPVGALDDFSADARNAAGAVFPALFSARIIEYRGEEVLVSTATDLTAPRKAERAAREASVRLHDAIEALDEGFALFDDRERLVLWNERYKSLNAHISGQLREGVTFSEIVDAGVQTGMFAQQHAEKIQNIFGAPAATAPDRQRDEFQRRDGRWYSVSRHPTSDGGFVITRQDITERKQAEEAERAADELLREVIEACPVNLVMCRYSDGLLTYTSENAAATFGRKTYVHEYWADKKAGLALTRAIKPDGNLDERVFQLKQKDGDVLTVALSSRRIIFRGEDMVVSQAYDLTERVSMQEELDRQTEMLHQTEKLSALGELLAGVAHELNNPLSVVVGHALMLEEELSDTDTLNRIKRISSAADRCARIVKSFLSMARQKPAQLTRTDVAQVIETALDVAGYGLRSAGATVEVAVDEDAPAVMADEDQLTQVFANLIVNAEAVLSEFGEAGRLVISIAKDGDHGVEIRFADNGPGIPEAIRRRIFEPFFTTKRVGEGTGIGLAFCHRVIVAHDGRISATTSPEGGACFVINLPAASETDPASAAPEESKVSTGVILVVDDEPDVLELIAHMLRRDGHAVHTAPDAETALRQLPGEFDLLLSDLNMPGMGGRALLQAINDEWPALAERVAFITGDTVSPESHKFLEETARPVLEKPVAPDELRKLVAQFIPAANKGASQ